MSRYPDKSFDLAITDPPYGIGEEWKKRRWNFSRGRRFTETSYKNDKIPSKEYFDELFRVSKEQIIFGYNYFTEFLGSTNYLIIWDKLGSNNCSICYSKAEIAYTSIHIPVFVFHVPWDGHRRGKETGLARIHPHQKPLELYLQILRKYAESGWSVLDTHMGSGSSVIACHKLGLDVTACDIDPHYFKSAKKRVDSETGNLELFPDELRAFQENFLFEDLKEAQ
jgi:site-specific DNA-methyltransferase (adenine-specific)